MNLVDFFLPVRREEVKLAPGSPRCMIHFQTYNDVMTLTFKGVIELQHVVDEIDAQLRCVADLQVDAAITDDRASSLTLG